jgi:hypothetical protein
VIDANPHRKAQKRVMEKLFGASKAKKAMEKAPPVAQPFRKKAKLSS